MFARELEFLDGLTLYASQRTQNVTTYKIKMIKLISVLALTIFGYTLQAHNLTIINQDFEEAKKTAIKEHKLLIIDFYTVWCEPCKVLDKNIFQNEKHSETISEKFIVLKYDAENDSVYNLSLKYHISSYPTTVIINAENSHRFTD
jgi:thiol:disulfide interchange protein